MAKTRAELVSEARAHVVEISPTEAKQRLDRGEIDLLLDIREAEEWRAEHLPGARHTPRGRLEWLADPTYARHDMELAGQTEKRILMYCGGGGRSVLAAQTLNQLGYGRVASMRGGFRAWRALGLPVE